MKTELAMQAPSAIKTALSSALFVGTIRHRRYFPTPHGFRYPIFMSYIDLDEVDSMFRGRWFWSTNRRNLAEYRRSDFLGPIERPLKEAVLDRVQAHTSERPSGPVRLLTHLRYWGLSFNPVSFYYCFEADGKTLHSIIAEITNTPWRERHAYVLPVKSATRHGSAWHWDFEKLFHVSPFLPMGLRYDWRFQPPGENLRVHMDVHQPAGNLDAVETASPETRPDTCPDASAVTRQFDSTLVLGRKEITSVNLALALVRFPFITLSVLLKIYWHAFLIKWKRNPFYDHPKLS